ncbi:MAG: ABC transporter ATP-binding protein [Acetobacteraceae bacterium]
MSLFAAEIGSAGYGRLTVLSRVALEVDQGEVLVVLGGNGAGKTTTLKAMMGTVRSEGRRVMLDGADLSGLPSWRLPGQGVVFVPDGARCFPNLTVIDNLRGAFAATHARHQGRGEKERLESVRALFPLLRERASQVAATLSGGQRQMLAVGRALMTSPRVLLLDEPSAGLAPKVVEELFEALGEIKSESGCAIVMAEQNVDYAARIADRCIVLEEGHVALSGAMRDVISHERLRVAYLGL